VVKLLLDGYIAHLKMLVQISFIAFFVHLFLPVFYALFDKFTVAMLKMSHS